MPEAPQQDDTKIRETIARLKPGQGGSLQALPIEVHNGAEYAIEYRTSTENGFDRLDAIDITRFEADCDGKLYLLAARVTAELEPDVNGGHVASFWPDEGNSTLITRDGGERWCSSWSVSLSADPELSAQLMDELEASVNAGGALNLFPGGMAALAAEHLAAPPTRPTYFNAGPEELLEVNPPRRFDLVAIRAHALAQVADIRAGNFGTDPFDTLTTQEDALASYERTVAKVDALIGMHGRFLAADHDDARGLG